MFNLALPATNEFATEYIKQVSPVHQFFSYHYQHPHTYVNRMKELRKRVFHREDLVHVIKSFMGHYPSSNQVEISLQKLEDSSSAVVIGGQQAGLLTGPLYTIHKIISIIAFADQKEKELGIPVIPVFWIAGEDHDYDEINHIYTVESNKIRKNTYPQKVTEKRMISDVPLDRELAFEWVREIVASFGETLHTNHLLQFTDEVLRRSHTVVDFFTHIVMEMFKDFGLLVVDSGDENFRKLQSEHFVRQIQHHYEFTLAILSQQQKIADLGFSRALHMDKDAVNIFLYTNMERELLRYDHGFFKDKNNSHGFTAEELLHIARSQPEKLSSNVATRPFVQETLFPTLAFIAGPGEIAYWAELSEAFQLFGLKMPPVVPRLNITIVDRAIHQDIMALNLKLADVLQTGVQEDKHRYIAAQVDATIEEDFGELKRYISERYKKIIPKMAEVDQGLLYMAQKNQQLIHSQLDFMVQRVERAVEQKEETILHKFDRIGNFIRPLDVYQERIICGYYYLNQYGWDFFKQLTQLPFTFDGQHKVILI